MQIATWYNLVQKKHEAIVIGRGRPVRQDASISEREKSTREFFTGTSKDEALMALANNYGMSLEDVKAAIDKDTKVVYKGKREHPKGWSRKVEVAEV
jgi:hypothetical protein